LNSNSLPKKRDVDKSSPKECVENLPPRFTDHLCHFPDLSLSRREEKPTSIEKGREIEK